MKTCLILLLVFFPFISFSQEQYTFEHDGMTREYILYIPEGLPDGSPLVFVLHGYTSNAQTIMNISAMNNVAYSEGFAVCYPQGSKANNGITHWNANLTISDRDDVGFLSELAKYLQDQYRLNPRNTFVCGMSNGGFMSYTLACESSSVFKAIASVTGTMSGYDWNNCDPYQPVPVFQISGIDDDHVPIDGSLTEQGGWGGAPGIEEVIEFWSELNECKNVWRDTIPVGDKTFATYHTDGIYSNEVWLYLLGGWGHKWPGRTSNTGIVASWDIWDFFSIWLHRTDVEENEKQNAEANTSILIYPNPATERINISSPKYLSSIGEIKIYNTMGYCVINSKANLSGSTSIDVSNLTPGIYSIIIKTQTNTLPGKFIKL